MNLSAALSAEGLADLLSHPRLMAVGDAVARANIQALGEMDPQTRWLNADLGRSSLCATLLMLDAVGGATGVGLIATAQSYDFCSRGRVLSFLNYAQAHGRIVIPGGHEPWTRRRLVVSEAFEAPFRRMTALRLRAMAPVAPELGRAAERLDGPGPHRALLAATAIMLNASPQTFAGPPTPITLFMAHDGGMDILRDLTASQPADRARYLVSAPLSRLALAKRSNVSHTQVTRVLTAAAAAGLVILTKARVEFSQALSDDALHHLAFIVRCSQLACTAAGLSV
jgi:hypothetical protein